MSPREIIDYLIFFHDLFVVELADVVSGPELGKHRGYVRNVLGVKVLLGVLGNNLISSLSINLNLNFILA